MGDPSDGNHSDGEFEAFFRDQYASVVRTLVPIVGDRAEAEAVAQDAFVAAMARWRRIAQYDKPGAWVRRVAIRDAVRAAQRRDRHRPLPGGEAGAAGDAVAGDGTAHAADLDLHRAIAALPARQRAAVVLHHLAGWPAAEVADAMGCSAPTVRVHLHRARQALAVTLADTDPHAAASPALEAARPTEEADDGSR